MTASVDRYYAERVHPRDVCPWPGCENTKPITYGFCTGRQCQSDRLVVRLSQWYEELPGPTEAQRAVLAAKEGRYVEQRRRWSSNQRARMAERRVGLRRLRAEASLSNERLRHDELVRAKADASAELFAIIEDQVADDRRKVVGDRWVLHLDSTRHDGSEMRDFYESYMPSSGRWSDPTWDAVSARLEIEERLKAQAAEMFQPATIAESVPWGDASGPIPMVALHAPGGMARRARSRKQKQKIAYSAGQPGHRPARKSKAAR